MRSAVLILFFVSSLIAHAQVPGFTKKLLYDLPYDASYNEVLEAAAQDTNFIKQDHSLQHPWLWYIGKIQKPLYFSQAPDSSFIAFSSADTVSKRSPLPLRDGIWITHHYSDKLRAEQEFEALGKWTRKQYAKEKSLDITDSVFNYAGEKRWIFYFSHHLIKRIEILCNFEADRSSGILSYNISLSPIVLPNIDQLFCRLPLDSAFDLIVLRALQNEEMKLVTGGLAEYGMVWNIKDPLHTLKEIKHTPQEARLQIHVDKNEKKNDERTMRLTLFLYYDSPLTADKEYLQLIDRFEKLGIASQKLETGMKIGTITLSGYGKRYLYTKHPLARTATVTYQSFPGDHPYMVSIELIRSAE